MSARPLQWYEPTDHPCDRDATAFMAHGIGGRYAIYLPDKAGRVYLWFARDEFTFKTFESIETAKEFAEADWQAAYKECEGVNVEVEGTRTTNE